MDNRSLYPCYTLLFIGDQTHGELSILFLDASERSPMLHDYHKDPGYSGEAEEDA